MELAQLLPEYTVMKSSTFLSRPRYLENIFAYGLDLFMIAMFY